MANLYERAIDIFNKNINPEISRGKTTPMPYQDPSTATTVEQLKNDFNKFLNSFFDSGRMMALATFPEAPTTNVLGKLVSELQTDVEVFEGLKEGIITGTLPYVTGYTGFSGDVERQEGNYLVLHFAYDTTAYPTAKVELNVNDKGVPATVDLDSDMNLVARIVDKDLQKLSVVLYDADDKEVGRFRYNLSGLVLGEKD